MSADVQFDNIGVCKSILLSVAFAALVAALIIDAAIKHAVGAACRLVGKGAV